MRRNVAGWLGVSSIALMLANGCAGEAPRDAGGTVMAMSAGAIVKPEDADLNIGAWIDPGLIRSVERKIRDNAGVNETIQLASADGSARGRISSQRMVAAFFSQRTADDIGSEERFNDLVAKLPGYVRHEPPQPVSNGRSAKTIGFKTVATASTSKCFVAKVGYRFGKPTVYSNDFNNPDTVLTLSYCQPSDNFPDLETLVARVSVTEQADVVAIRSRVAASANAKTGPARDVRPIAVQWGGYPGPVAGQIELEQTRQGGTIRLTLPNNEGQCGGSYRVENNGRGTWQVACNNGLTASGTMQTHGSGRGSSGEGKDSKGQPVRFTLGAA